MEFGAFGRQERMPALDGRLGAGDRLELTAAQEGKWERDGSV